MPKLATRATCPTADAVLLLGPLLGPLYHLVEREDRLAGLREIQRVLRPGGLVWGAAISRFASLCDSAVERNRR
jgi:hypothetical protein